MYTDITHLPKHIQPAKQQAVLVVPVQIVFADRAEQGHVVAIVASTPTASRLDIPQSTVYTRYTAIRIDLDTM